MIPLVIHVPRKVPTHYSVLSNIALEAESADRERMQVMQKQQSKQEPQNNSVQLSKNKASRELYHVLNDAWPSLETVRCILSHSSLHVINFIILR